MYHNWDFGVVIPIIRRNPKTGSIRVGVKVSYSDESTVSDSTQLVINLPTLIDDPCVFYSGGRLKI